MASVLVHIGYHKSGGGWLRRLFFTDPDTGFGTIGKSGRNHPVRRLVAARPFEFDADAMQAEFEPLLAPVRDEGRIPVVAFERFTGHPFSGGHDGKEIADRLAKVFPEASILVVIREQRSMIVSTYKQYIREGGALRLWGFMNPPTSKSMRVPWFDLRHFEYHHLLAYYRQLFGPDAVLALTYEQFVADAPAFVAEIARFAGRPLSSDVLASLPFEAKTNPGPPATAIAARRLVNGLGVCTDLNPAPLFPSPAFWRLGKRIDRATLAPQRVVAREEAKLRRAVAETVGDRYVESNRRTAELTGVDLAAYGWMT